MQFRCLLAGVALAAAATACNGDDEGATPLTDPPATSAPATTTTAPTTSTTLDFETEVKLAALALIEVRNEVLMAPDPARVPEFLSEFCTCLEREHGVIQRFSEEGRRWTTPPVEPLGIRLDSTDARSPSLTLIARQPPGSIEGPSGNQEVLEVELAPYVIVLLRDESGAWRINGLEGIRMARQAALDIVETEGLP